MRDEARVRDRAPQTARSGDWWRILLIMHAAVIFSVQLDTKFTHNLFFLVYSCIFRIFARGISNQWKLKFVFKL